MADAVQTEPETFVGDKEKAKDSKGNISLFGLLNSCTF